MAGMSVVNPIYKVEGNYTTIIESVIHATGLTAGGTMLTVTFTVKPGWTGYSPVTLTCDEFINANSDPITNIYETIPHTITNGGITVPSVAGVQITDGKSAI